MFLHSCFTHYYNQIRWSFSDNKLYLLLCNIFLHRNESARSRVLYYRKILVLNCKNCGKEVGLFLWIKQTIKQYWGKAWSQVRKSRAGTVVRHATTGVDGSGYHAQDTKLGFITYFPRSIRAANFQWSRSVATNTSLNRSEPKRFTLQGFRCQRWELGVVLVEKLPVCLRYEALFSLVWMNPSQQLIGW